MTLNTKTLNLSAKEFKSDQEVKWCPGCGDYAILVAVQKAMPELGIPRENYAVISGIGCSSRFPYYMNTYGFHSIHGRAAAIATGVKLAKPELSVWQITGDGDALAIGGNHFIHEIRRNVDINILLFNNEIYGLTKGQFSPTSKTGAKTKTSPHGTVERPFHPGQLVMGANGTFFARALDTNIKHTTEVMIQAAQHKGASVVEILQNCVIYNDKTHAAITDREHKDDRQLLLEHGKPMLFGKKKEKGLRLRGLELEIVEIGRDGVTLDDILVHDAKTANPALHWMLASMEAPEFPVAFGVIRAYETPSFEDNVAHQIAEQQESSPIRCMDDLLFSGTTWAVN